MEITHEEKIAHCKVETLKHIQLVREKMLAMMDDLENRLQHHDDSKLVEPELSIFAEFTPLLKETEYGSDEYKELLEKVKPALDNHYAKNRHHPEHHKNGVDDMTLLDLVEMLCDWSAATERNKNGNIRKSIEQNKERFGMSEQLAQIFENTVREHFR